MLAGGLFLRHHNASQLAILKPTVQLSLHYC
jgi:hypothetical protein